MIIIKINRNCKEKQIRSKPKKKENATTKVTKTYTQKEEKKNQISGICNDKQQQQQNKNKQKKYKKNIARPKWNRGMHKGRLN